MEPKPHILEYSREQLQAWMTGQGLPVFRAAQARLWLMRRRAATFEEMTDMPVPLRGRLDDAFRIWSTRVAAEHKAGDGTEKLLLELHDKQHIECVLLRDDKGHCTTCISTQVGCAMGCTFCASGIDGLARNLARGEIIEQMLRLQRLLGDRERLSHVVVMGMGEPLLNLDALMDALAETAAPDALGISARRITISSVGLPGGIRRLADLNCQYHLAVSLHAAEDELRNTIVPYNRNIGIAPIIEATDYYFQQTGRRVTFEYVLLADVNDRPEHARRLVALLKGRPALVNIIPYNPVVSLAYRSPSPKAVAAFVETLRRGGLKVEVRRRKGDRINAACGQLRRSKEGQDD
jgi:23S rRNA (adenine2503-C2)-methyltransferase